MRILKSLARRRSFTSARWWAEQDIPSQKNALLFSRVLITVVSIIAFIVGFVCQKFMYTVIGNLASIAIAIVVSLVAVCACVAHVEEARIEICGVAVGR